MGDTKNLDVVLVSDAVGTATPNQQGILRTFSMMFGQQTSQELVQHLRTHEGDMAYMLPPAEPSGQLLAKYSMGSGVKITSNTPWHILSRGALLPALASALVGLACGVAVALVLRSQSDRTD